MATRHFGQFEQTLLYAVLSLQDADGGANGPTIRGLIESQTSRVVSPGAIYTALTRLEDRGFVTSELGEPTAERGGKRKRHYRMHATGLAALRQAEASLARMARLTRTRS